jgi:hypothetical protein
MINCDVFDVWNGINLFLFINISEEESIVNNAEHIAL